MKGLKCQFDVMIEKKINPKSVAKDFGDMGLEETPTFEKYEDETVEETPDEPPEEIEPAPDLSTGV